MSAAEQSGAFRYEGSVSSSAEIEKSSETLIERLEDLTIPARESSKRPDTPIVSIAKSVVCEKATTKPASSTRPLTVDDDDDLDIDLEIDDNIDTTVSSLILTSMFPWEDLLIPQSLLRNPCL